MRISPKLIAAAFWGALIFALVMALLPKPPHLPGDPSDKVQHILAFTVLTALAVAAFGRSAFAKIAGGLFAYGALIEILQSIPMLHRDASVWDWVADCAAVIVVLLIASLLPQRRDRRSG